MTNLLISLELYLNHILQNNLPHSLALILEETSHFISPTATFLLFFPIVHFLYNPEGLSTRIFTSKLVFAIALADWSNTILKWFFFGNRPYWTDNTLRQFPGTCETGPGNPSGHCMVTVAAFTVIGLIIPKLKKIFSILVVMIAFSRIYLGCHFSHQVLLGSFFGYLIGNYSLRIDSDKITKSSFWLFTGSILIFSGLFTYLLAIFILKIDLSWSIALAKINCQNKAWLNLTTTPINTLFRVGGGALGMSVYTVERSGLSVYKVTSLVKLSLVVFVYFMLIPKLQNEHVSGENAIYLTSFLHWFTLPLLLSKL